MDQEGSTKFILPMLKLFAQLSFDLGQLLRNPFAHLLFTEKLARITLLALVSTAHKTGGILAGSGESLPVSQKAAMLLNQLKGWGTLLLECLQTGDLSLVGLEQCITAHVREGGSKVEHLLLREEEAVPKLLQAAASIFDKQVHILPLQFIETSQLFLKFVDSAETTATIGRKERLAIRFLNPESLPEALDIRPKLLDLAFASLLLIHQLVALSHQAGQVGLVKSKLLRRLAIVFDNI
jgi:hypothetical protein